MAVSMTPLGIAFKKTKKSVFSDNPEFKASRINQGRQRRAQLLQEKIRKVRGRLPRLFLLTFILLPGTLQLLAI